MHSPSAKAKAPALSALKAMRDLPVPRVHKAQWERQALQATSCRARQVRQDLPDQ